MPKTGFWWTSSPNSLKRACETTILLQRMQHSQCSKSGQKMIGIARPKRHVQRVVELSSSTRLERSWAYQGPLPIRVSWLPTGDGKPHVLCTTTLGSSSLAAAKCALRNLADTLRMEVLRYNCPESTYTIHCAFPADFMSPGFALEQRTKTPLNKKLQGISPGTDISQLEARYPSSERIASLVIAAVDHGDFTICPASFASSALFCNMIGPSPKRGWGIMDSLVSVLTGWFVWPILRRRWEALCREDGEERRRNMH